MYRQTTQIYTDLLHLIYKHFAVRNSLKIIHKEIIKKSVKRTQFENQTTLNSLLLNKLKRSGSDIDTCVSDQPKPHSANKAVHSHGNVTFCWSSTCETSLRNSR